MEYTDLRNKSHDDVEDETSSYLCSFNSYICSFLTIDYCSGCYGCYDMNCNPDCDADCNTDCDADFDD